MTHHQKKEIRRQRLQKLLGALRTLFPKASIELVYRTPWELLVAVILSAQCTDKRVNRVTDALFKKYPNLSAYVHALPHEFENDIRSCGYFRAKAKYILATAKNIHTVHHGEMPRTIDELVRLPGVGRKTATVVLAEAFGIVEGITVDAHVIRFVQRFDLSDSTDPLRIERDLMKILPYEEWRTFTHRVIHYGRYIAPARPYDTSKDPLIAIYPPAKTHFRTRKK